MVEESVSTTAPPTHRLPARTVVGFTLVSAAALIIVIVGVAAWVTGGRSGETDSSTVHTSTSSDETDVADTAGVELPFLGLDPDRQGDLGVAGGFDPADPNDRTGWLLGPTALDDGEARGATWLYFGDPDSTDPFTTHDLMVQVVPVRRAFENAVSEMAESVPGAEALTVRNVQGVMGVLQGLPQTEPIRVLSWIEPEDEHHPRRGLTLATHHLSAAQLLDIAERLDLDGEIEDAARSVGESDLAIVARSAARPEGSLPDFVRYLETGPQLLYGVRRSTSDLGTTAVDARSATHIKIASRPGDLPEALLPERFWSRAVDVVELDGEPALIIDMGSVAEDDPRSHLIVAWQWSPGVIAVVSMRGTGGPSTAMEAARSVVELEPERWRMERDIAHLVRFHTPAITDPWFSAPGSDPPTAGDILYVWHVGTIDGRDCIETMSEDGRSFGCTRDDWVAPSASSTAAAIAAMDVHELRGRRPMQIILIAAVPGAVIVPQPASDEWSMTSIPEPHDGLSWHVWVGPQDGLTGFHVVVAGSVVDTLEPGGSSPEQPAAVPGWPDPAIPMLPPSLTSIISEFDPYEMVAQNLAARGLGIASTLVIEAGDETALPMADEPLQWVVGEADGTHYLVHDGAAVGGGPIGDEISVLEPVTIEGAPVTLIVWRRMPSCLDVSRVRGEDVQLQVGPSISLVASVNEPDLRDVVYVWAVAGVAQSWQLTFERDDRAGGPDEVVIDLPEVEGLASWPVGACG